MFPQEPLEVPFRLAAAGVLGLVVGSFANVCIHRLPLEESVVAPRSRCPSCGRPIRSYDNIPLLSYLLLRGRCRSCRAPISLRYPAVEAANGALYLLTVAVFGPTPMSLLTMAFLTALLILLLIDWDHHLLPDAITLPGIAVGLAASFLPDWPVTPRDAFLTAGCGFLAFAAFATAFRLVRGVEGLGQGDWKMAAMLGAFFGWRRLLVTVFLASISGTLVGLALIAFRGKTFRHALPLGTFLGLAAIVTVFVGDDLFGWYGGLMP